MSQTSYLFAPSYKRFAQPTEGYWRVRRFDGRQSFVAGTCQTKDEATKVIVQIRKLHPGSTFQIEFIGKNISHQGS